MIFTDGVAKLKSGVGEKHLLVVSTPDVIHVHEKDKINDIFFQHKVTAYIFFCIS